MDASKKKRLKAAGWSTGSVSQFLDLTADETALIEIKLRLSELIKKARTRRGLSQTALAERLGSSQSRVAKIEAGDPSVSLDLLVRASFASGATRRELARAIAEALDGLRETTHLLRSPRNAARLFTAVQRAQRA